MKKKLLKDIVIPAGTVPPVTLESTCSRVTQDAYQAALVKVECGESGIADAETIRGWVRIQTDCAARWQAACFEDDAKTDDE